MMKITISGKPGSGKSTVSKKLASVLDYEHFSTGDFMRSLADERNVSLIELSKIAEKDDSVDALLDKRQKEFGKEKDDFVLDARLGFYFIPDSKKVYLDVSDEEALKRVHGRDETSKEDFYARLDSERKRYKELYGLNYEDYSHYDIIVKTDTLTPEEIVDLILKML